MIKTYFTIAIVLIATVIQAAGQPLLVSGYVFNDKREALPGATVFLLPNNKLGALADAQGFFQLDRQTRDNNRLVVRFEGYLPDTLNLSLVNTTQTIKVYLRKKARTLNEVQIVDARYLTGEFPARSMSRMDILMDPFSNGDPLKAVSNTPASTNTNETADVELRGSSQYRSLVYLNQVPIYKPVRSTSLNDLGFFSLFNPRIIRDLLIYPMSPPLNMGHTSAGLIDIQTNREVEESSVELSLSMANVGMFVSQKGKSDDQFIQAYANYQRPELFLALNSGSFPSLRDFKLADMGANWRLPVGDKWHVNGFSYMINESNAARIDLYAQQNVANANTFRHFHIVNAERLSGNNYLQINAAVDQSSEGYSHALVNATQRKVFAYGSINYTRYLSKHWQFQAGADYSYHNHSFQDTFPEYYYAFRPNDPTLTSDTVLAYNYAEVFGILKMKYSPFTLQLGVRQNFNDLDLNNYFSYQANANLQISPNASILLGLGQYYNLSLPRPRAQVVNLLESKQANLEFRYGSKKLRGNLSVFYKNETGEVIDFIATTESTREIFGVEAEIIYRPSRKWMFQFGNQYLDNTVFYQNVAYQVNPDLPYFIKAGVSWFTLYGNISVKYVTRPGTFFTPIEGAQWNPELGINEPVFGNTINTERLNHYHNVGLTYSYLTLLGGKSTVIYANLNNIFNIKNQQNPIYNPDYTIQGFNYFQQITFYTGLVISL